MNRTKLSFGFMILFFIFLIFLATIFYERFSSLPSKVTGYSILGFAGDDSHDEKLMEYTYSNLSAQSACTFSFPHNKTIILRLDDVGAWHYYETVVNLVSVMLDRNMSVTLGVIPHELEKDQPFLDWAASIKNNPHVEFAQHGNLHLENEFQNLSMDEAYSAVEEGKNSMMEHLKIVPVTFIPPSNEYNAATIEALKALHFNFISARDAEYKTDGTLTYIGSDTRTYDYYVNERVSVAQIVQDCQKSLEQKNVCVIVMHPQEYVTTENPALIDVRKYAQFEQLLNELSLLDAEFKTFKDLTACGVQPVSFVPIHDANQSDEFVYIG